MIKFKIGDQVKFLNESGGGVVSRIISPKMVKVAIGDGFEIPIMTSELIRIEEEAPFDSPKHMFREEFSAEIEPLTEEEYKDDERNIRLLNNPSRGTVERGIYLAFVPEDQKWLITGILDVYLVNHSQIDILYSIFLEQEEGAYQGFDYGSIDPGSMVLLESIEREKIEKWGKGIVQVLFHAEKSKKVLDPGNANFKIKLPRFYKENNYHDSAIIIGKSILISLLPLSAQLSHMSGDFISKEKQEPTESRPATEVKPEHIIDKHKTSPREAVVDLHIDELTEHSSGMDSSQMLRLQVNYFTRCLDNAIANNLSKVTFIHGVGTGVLKTAIKEILKDYSNVELRDGSMQQFGYGAMDVILK